MAPPPVWIIASDITEVSTESKQHTRGHCSRRCGREEGQKGLSRPFECVCTSSEGFWVHDILVSQSPTICLPALYCGFLWSFWILESSTKRRDGWWMAIASVIQCPVETHAQQVATSFLSSLHHQPLAGCFRDKGYETDQDPWAQVIYNGGEGALASWSTRKPAPSREGPSHGGAR